MCRHPHARTKYQRDDGVTLIEVLVAIVLLGMTVSAVLVALRTTTSSTVIDRDHANSFSWLQAASDEIYRGDRIPCTSGQAAAIASYDAAAKAVPRPPLWSSSSTATIAVTNVEYLGKFAPDGEFEWDSSFCFEGGIYVDSPLYTQRVTITATTPSGLIKTLQMVKNEKNVVTGP